MPTLQTLAFGRMHPIAVIWTAYKPVSAPVPLQYHCNKPDTVGNSNTREMRLRNLRTPGLFNEEEHLVLTQSQTREVLDRLKGCWYKKTMKIKKQIQNEWKKKNNKTRKPSGEWRRGKRTSWRSCDPALPEHTTEERAERRERERGVCVVDWRISLPCMVFPRPCPDFQPCFSSSRCPMLS